MMVSVSTLISDIEGVTGSRFQESLGVVNSYAKKDKLLAVCFVNNIMYFLIDQPVYFTIFIWLFDVLQLDYRKYPYVIFCFSERSIWL